MAYCYKCNSEIKTDAAFCPYCGSPQNSAAASNIEQAETEMQNSAEKTENINSEKSSDNNALSQISGGENNDFERQAEENPARETVQLPIENFENETEKAEIAASFLKEEQKEAELAEINLQDSINKELFDEISGNETETSEAIVNSGANEKLNDSGNQTESSLMSYEETEVKEADEVEELNESGGEFSSDENREAGEVENEPAVQIPYIAPAFDDSENAEQNDSPKITENDIENSGDKSEQAAENKNSNSAEPTAVGAKTALENSSEQNQQPRVESVQIMESRGEEEDDDAEKSYAEKMRGNERQAEIFATPKAENSAAENSREQQVKSAPPSTTPNIGGTTDGKKSAKLKPLGEGTILNGRYEIVRKIGGGGMGAVYLASDKNLGGVLRAVKEMVQSYIEDEQQQKAVSDFKRESMLLTSLEHQSIPTIYDYFFDEKEARFYLVMKYVSGGDLASRLRAATQNRIDEKLVTEWGIQIADVLDYLHNRQPPIVYRDLKPANIMVDGNSGRAMLIDFGIARWINKEEKGVTAVGTMGYAPPELFSGNVEPRSDIYSLGSTMFHLLTGADPQSNPLLIFDFQKHPRPRQINPQLSDQIEKILMRAVEYNADKRFSSALELKQALETHLENLNSGKATYGVRQIPAAISLSEQQVFCGFCGQKIVASDMFCAFCGAKQPIAGEGVRSAKYLSRNGTAQLLIIGTNELETPAFTIEKDENLLGRRDPMSNIFPEVDLSKYDPLTKISRRHALLRREGDCFVVEDLGSSNGTTVTSAVKETFRLQPRQPYTLTNGDKLKLGDTTLHFIIG